MAFATRQCEMLPAAVLTLLTEAGVPRVRNIRITDGTTRNYTQTTDVLCELYPSLQPYTPTNYIVNRRDRLRTKGVSEGA